MQRASAEADMQIFGAKFIPSRIPKVVEIMTVKKLSAVVAFLTGLTLFAQTETTHMQFEPGYLTSRRVWSVSYKGETYREFSRKPQKIALDCGCQDAADLFKKARNRFGMTYLIPLTGLVTGYAMAIQFYDNDDAEDYYQLYMGSMIFYGFISLYQSRKTAGEAVLAFNQCMDKVVQ